jgi:hypothetical protein
MAQIRTNAHFRHTNDRAFQYFGFKIAAMQNLAETMAQHFADPQLSLARRLTRNIFFARCGDHID